MSFVVVVCYGYWDDGPDGTCFGPFETREEAEKWIENPLVREVHVPKAYDSDDGVRVMDTEIVKLVPPGEIERVRDEQFGRDTDAMP